MIKVYGLNHEPLISTYRPGSYPMIKHADQEQILGSLRQGFSSRGLCRVVIPTLCNAKDEKIPSWIVTKTSLEFPSWNHDPRVHDVLAWCSALQELHGEFLCHRSREDLENVQSSFGFWGIAHWIADEGSYERKAFTHKLTMFYEIYKFIIKMIVHNICLRGGLRYLRSCIHSFNCLPT